MSLRSLLVLAVFASPLVASCRRDEPPSPSPAALPSPAPSAHVATAPSASSSARRAVAPVPAITPDARRAYAKHLRDGRALAAQRKWGESEAELEKALASVPHDPRALTELGWALFQAGDVKRARKVSKEASERATEPQLQASALYNLGRAEEALGHAALAAKHYAASLALRPNDTVQKQLDAVRRGASAPPTPSLPCVDPMPLDDLVTCLAASRAPSENDDEAPASRPELLPPEGALAALANRVRVVRSPADSFDDTFFLAASSLRGWSVVADLGSTHNPGAFGIHEEFSLPTAELRHPKGATVLWLETLRERGDSDMGIDEYESETRREVTICLLADEKRRETTCPVTSPLAFTFKRERMGLGDVDEETKKLQTPGLPIVHESTFAVTIDDEGTVTTRLVKGVAEGEDKKRLGTAKLAL